MQLTKQSQVLTTVLKATMLFYILGLILIIISVPTAQSVGSKETFQGLVISGMVLACLCSLIIVAIYFASIYYKMCSVFLLPFVILFIFNVVIVSMMIAYINTGVITAPVI